MKKSVLLNYLLARAEELRTADGKKMLSANYFFASLLQILEQKANDQLPDEINIDEVIKELDEISTLLTDYDLDYKATHEKIIQLIHAVEYNSSADELVFGKLNLSVEPKSRRLGRAEIDAYVYVSMILEDPTEAIKASIVSAKKSEAASAAKPSGTSLDDLLKKFMEHQASTKVEEEAQKRAELDAKEQEARAAREAQEAKESMTGMQRLSETVFDTGRIQKFLLESIFGQDYAVNSFVSGYFQSLLMKQSGRGGKKPQATFLFAGPPGVGKTFLAEKAAEALGLPYTRFDMSGYSDKEANFEFCGSDGVYKGSHEGNVTGFVRKNPRCVILFDEIEKAHINVIYLFLQMLDAGRLHDNFHDEEVSFTDAVIILTTNVGKNLYSDPSISNLSTLPRKNIIKALETDVNPETKIPLFPAAICSRFASGNVVMFNHLGAGNLYTIARRELAQNAAGFAESTGISITVDDKVPTAIILGEGGKADARTVKGRANALFHEELYEFFRLLSPESGIMDKLKSIHINVSLDNVDESIAKMFVNPRLPEVLIFAKPDSFSPRVLPHNVICHVTDDIAEAKEILFNYDISIILCDVFCNSQASDKKLLNAEDIASAGRDFLTYALSRYGIPVYLLQLERGDISPEELLSFAKLGVIDILTLKGGKKGSFEKTLIQKCDTAYRQSNMLKLARENKVLTYKSMQLISRNKKNAEIMLFDFKLGLATDTEDSKSILDNVSKPNVHFADVIGAEDAKRELTYFVEYLKDPVKYIRRGVRAPKGVLLYGPPGTGKTLLAKAMAGESDVTFLTAEGNQFLKKYVGEGSGAVHDLFAAARKYAPSILFIDEIDAIGKDRNSAEGQHIASTLTAFLTEMDGFNTDTTKPVFVLAATNYEVEPGTSRSLDPALLRRFDRRIYVDLPTKEERKRFLAMKVAGSKMVTLSDEQIENIAIRSTGMSLAELDSVYEMALRNAICSENCTVDDTAFEEAFETFNSGEKKQWNRELLERTARHEAGHALLCWLGGEKPSYLTIVARGDHGGYMQHADSEGKALYTKTELLQRIRTSLAGRAAELVYYGAEEGVSTGASGDLATATRIAEQMICKYGMDAEIGLSYLNDPEKSILYYNEIRRRTNEILAAELNATVEILAKQRAAIDQMVETLMERNHLKENEIDAIFHAAVVR